MKEIRLVIAIPSTQTWEAEFGMSLVFFTNYLAAHGAIGKKAVQFRVHNKRGSILASMREDLVKQAVEGDATHLLFIDSDQTFPADIFHRMMKWGKQIVAANITTKMLPPSTTARIADGVPLFTSETDKSLEEVWRVGTGIMLINLNVFKREGMEAPWFNQHWNPEQGNYVGEDWAFCEKLQKAGVKLYVDQGVSWEVGHLGKLAYGHDMVIETMNEKVA